MTSRALSGRPSPWPLICAAAVFVLFMAIIVGRMMGGDAAIDDDAYYYFKIASNIAATGVSTFDGQSLTNGYHPLWLAVLVLQYMTVGHALIVSQALQALFYAGGVYLLLRAAPKAPALLQVGFTLALAGPIGHVGLGGMELALEVLCIGLFVAAMDWAGDGGSARGLLLGLAAAACVGARIDAALFIAPALAFAPLSRAKRGLAFAVLAVLGAAYAAYNLAMFGTAMPISSAIKSLGGLQINHRLIDQLGLGRDHHDRTPAFTLTLAWLVLSPALAALSRPRTKARTLAVASCIGGLVYVSRLFLASSWMVWPWYAFAMVFPMAAALYAAPPWIDAGVRRLGARVPPGRIAAAALGCSVAGLLAMGAWAGAAVLRPPRSFSNMDALNRLAVARYGPVLHGAAVAMGDRAGSFAMGYPGSVVQLEGLVNDKAYFDVIRQGGDVQGLLCRRGVRYVADYRTLLGSYDRLSIPVMRPFLTQFPAPALVVRRSDEVGHIQDLRLYDNRSAGEEGNNTLYIWRLRCG